MNSKNKISEQFILPNGLHVIFAHIPGAQTNSILAIIKAGPRYDPVGYEGLSHLIEHIKAREPLRYGKRLNDLETFATKPTGYSYQEKNKYSIRVLPEYTVEGLKILSQAVAYNEFIERDVNQEKKSIYAEMGTVEANQQKKIWELWMQKAFNKTDLGRPYIGTFKTVDSINKHIYRKFINKNYSAERIAFIISGQFDDEIKYNCLSFLKKLFPRSNKHNLLDQKKELSLSIINKPIMYIENNNSQTANIILGFLFKNNPVTNNLLLFFQSYLSGQQESILYKKLALSGLIYYLFCTVAILSDISYLTIHITASASKVNEVLRIILNELSETAQGNVKNEALESTKRLFITQHKLRHETSMEFANYYAQQLFINSEKLIDPNELYKNIESLSITDIKEGLCRIINPHTIKLVMLGNIKNHDIKNLYNTII